MPELALPLPALAQELHAFCALELPALLPHLDGLRDEADAESRLLAALDALQGDAGVALYPGATAEDAVRWQTSMLKTLVQGFFRRRAIQAGLTSDERLRMYRTMVLSRTLDDLLKRLFMEKSITWNGYPSPQKGFRALGNEAAVGHALRLQAGDVACPMIRGLPVVLMMTDDPEQVVLIQTGKKGTPMDGRDLHTGDFSKGVLPPTAPLAIGTQTLIGLAYAFKLRGSDRVAVSFMGEGGSSLGEWHEALTFAAAQSLNMVFVVENNHWALGTHWREQTAAPRFALKAAGYGIPWVTVFGNDADAVAAASIWAQERARRGLGPTLIECVTYRRSGHAHHDDDRFHGMSGVAGYELEAERKLWEAADPIQLYEDRLRSQNLLDDRSIQEIRQHAQKRVAAAEQVAHEAPWPESFDTVYAPRIDPVPQPPAAPQTRKLGYDEAIRQALAEMMEADPFVFVLGEDVGGRYGGAFGVTRGLAKQFGPQRCLNTVLAESAIVGAAVGAALDGFRPVVEMQFADFLACGFNALVNNAAKLYWRWRQPVPMVVRLPYGGATGTMNRLLGGGPYHSQCPENWFARVPGWKIVAPSTPEDAKGLLVAAIRDNNPVIFLESKGLYSIFRPDLKHDVPLGIEYEVPIGKARIHRLGQDVTILTYGAMLWTALEAAEILDGRGISAEVLDLRTLVPLDEATILDSIRRTHRVVILHEDTRRSGFGGELAAWLADVAFYDLDAPIVRVGAPDTPVPYAPPLEYRFLPKAEQVVEAAERTWNEST